MTPRVLLDFLYAATVTRDLPVFDIAFIDSSMTVNYYTAVLDDICANAPLSQIEVAFGLMFCQGAEFSRCEPHLVLFTLRQKHEVSQMLHASDDSFAIPISRCRRT